MFLFLVCIAVANAVLIHHGGHDASCKYIDSMPCATVEGALQTTTPHEIHFAAGIFESFGTLFLPSLNATSFHGDDQLMTVWNHHGEIRTHESCPILVIERIRMVGISNLSISSCYIFFYNSTMENMNILLHDAQHVSIQWLDISDSTITTTDAIFIGFHHGTMNRGIINSTNALQIFLLYSSIVKNSLISAFNTSENVNAHVLGNQIDSSSFDFPNHTSIRADVIAFYAFDLKTYPNAIHISMNIGLGYIPSEASNWFETNTSAANILYQPSEPFHSSHDLAARIKEHGRSEQRKREGDFVVLLEWIILLLKRLIPVAINLWYGTLCAFTMLFGLLYFEILTLNTRRPFF